MENDSLDAAGNLDSGLDDEAGHLDDAAGRWVAWTTPLDIWMAAWTTTDTWKCR